MQVKVSNMIQQWEILHVQEIHYMWLYVVYSSGPHVVKKIQMQKPL